jgi:hypothetical protein
VFLDLIKKIIFITSLLVLTKQYQETHEIITMENQKTTIPNWFWAVAVFSLLWNLMGVASFFQQITMTDEALKSLPLAEQELYSSYPLWTFIAFAFAVFGGIIGSIGLLMKKKWAKLAFIISLLAIIIQMIHTLFFTKAKEVYGAGTEVMPTLVIVCGVFLLWFSTFGIKKGWLK